MELAFVVYLIGVLPAVAQVLSVVGGLGSVILIVIGCILLVISRSLNCYSWDNPDEVAENRRVCAAWGKRSLKLSILTLFIALFTQLIPSERTMYTMVAAYAGQKIAETPQAAQIANDGVDVLKELLAKAKRELAEDKPKEAAK